MQSVVSAGLSVVCGAHGHWVRAHRGVGRSRGGGGAAQDRVVDEGRVWCRPHATHPDAPAWRITYLTLRAASASENAARSNGTTCVGRGGGGADSRREASDPCTPQRCSHRGRGHGGVRVMSSNCDAGVGERPMQLPPTSQAAPSPTRNAISPPDQRSPMVAGPNQTTHAPLCAGRCRSPPRSQAAGRENNVEQRARPERGVTQLSSAVQCDLALRRSKWGPPPARCAAAADRN